jgi:hypothetical protein
MAKRIRGVDEVEVTAQLILRLGDYSGSSKWAQYNHRNH